MGAYYKYFAYGLSQDEDYVAWVEPYQFATGVGKFQCSNWANIISKPDLCLDNN